MSCYICKAKSINNNADKTGLLTVHKPSNVIALMEEK